MWSLEALARWSRRFRLDLGVGLQCAVSMANLAVAGPPGTPSVDLTGLETPLQVARAAPLLLVPGTAGRLDPGVMKGPGPSAERGPPIWGTGSADVVSRRADRRLDWTPFAEQRWEPGWSVLLGPNSSLQVTYRRPWTF